MGLWKTIKKGAKSVSKAVGSVFGEISGTKATNKLNRDMAREQMDFQADMSNTQYQRAMTDMRQAGLNPILAYKQGGASSPAGASATMSNSVATGMDLLNKTTATALALKRNKLELKNLDQMFNKLVYETDQADALAEKTNQERRQQSVIADVMDASKPYLMTKAKWASDHPKVAEGEAVSESLRKLLGGGASALQQLTPLRKLGRGR